MIAAGMNGVRINLSHGSAESQKSKLDNIRRAAELKNAPEISVMYDLRGPEIRVKEVPGGQLTVYDGGILTLHCESTENASTIGHESGITFGNMVSVNWPDLCQQVKTGTRILIDDGKISLSVEDIQDRDIVCHVDRGGIVESCKGINVPDLKLEREYLSDEDRADICWCIENGADYLAGSFIRRAEDVKVLREFMNENGGEHVGLIAKIETKEALKNLDGIIAAADQVLIARGDMGVEIGYEKVPGVQKKITAKCRDAGKVVILATQLIDSMMENPLPTRAEASDIANAVYDGVTDLLVTGETARGKYPAAVVEEMNRITKQAEKDKAAGGYI